MSRGLLLIPALAACLASAPDATAQTSREGGLQGIQLSVVNALLGGLVGGVGRELTVGEFSVGVARGALGGWIAHMGRRLAASRHPGAGLLGRQVGAVGTSITRAAALGSGPLDTLLLPLGPVRAYVPVRRPGAARFHADLMAIGWLAYAVAHPDLHVDASESLSSGVFVFRSDEPIHLPAGQAGGLYTGGIVVLAPGRLGQSSLPHERVHVLQLDHLQGALVLPLESALRSRVAADPAPWIERLDAGIGFVPVWYSLQSLWGYEGSPWEVEARWIGGGW